MNMKVSFISETYYYFIIFYYYIIKHMLQMPSLYAYNYTLTNF